MHGTKQVTKSQDPTSKYNYNGYVGKAPINTFNSYRNRMLSVNAGLPRIGCQIGTQCARILVGQNTCVRENEEKVG